MKILWWLSSLFFFCIELHAVCVREGKAYLRKGPGQNYQRSWTVGKYMPFEEVSRQGNWVKLKDVDGEVHWAHGSILTRSVSCVVVKVPYAQLKAGPGERFGKASIWLADKYTAYKKIKDQDSWVQVENARQQKFWVSRKSLWEPVRIQKISF